MSKELAQSFFRGAHSDTEYKLSIELVYPEYFLMLDDCVMGVFMHFEQALWNFNRFNCILSEIETGKEHIFSDNFLI